MRARRLERLQLLLREEHVLILRVLVALDDLLFRDDLAGTGRYVLLVLARAVAPVDLVEADGDRRFRGRIELDWDRYQSKSDRRGSEGSRSHSRIIYARIDGRNKKRKRISDLSGEAKSGLNSGAVRSHEAARVPLRRAAPCRPCAAL